MYNSQAGFLMSQIKRIGGRLGDRVLDRAGINEFNGAQGKILYVLWQKDGLSIAELAKLTGLANTTLTSMLDRMEQSDLLKRKPDPSDRRKYLLILTPKAQSLKEKYLAVSEQMNELYFQGFQEQEIIEFEKYLLRILDNLKGAEANE